MPDFLLPDLGEGLEEAEVISWRVQVGDRVAVDQVIAEVETAKAVVEVPVPYAGVVAALHATPGSSVSVGQPLLTVTADEPAAGFREPGVVVPGQAPAAGNGSAGGASGNAAAGSAAAGDAPAPGEEASGSVLIGYGTTAAPARSRRGRRRTAAGAAAPSAAPATSPAAPAPAAAGQPSRVAVISPLVRKEARDAGLDLSSLTGTGPAGVVSRQDVRGAIAERAAPQQAPAPAAQNAGPETGAGERRIPLRGARRAAADKLSRSRREIPEATVWVDVDATGLVEARRALNAADPARPVKIGRAHV